jgi:hypothetical protein
LGTLRKRAAVVRGGAGGFADSRADLFAGFFGSRLRFVDCLAHGGAVIRSSYFVFEFRLIRFSDFLFTILAVFLLNVRRVSAILEFAIQLTLRILGTLRKRGAIVCGGTGGFADSRADWVADLVGGRLGIVDRLTDSSTVFATESEYFCHRIEW